MTTDPASILAQYPERRWEEGIPPDVWTALNEPDPEWEWFRSSGWIVYRLFDTIDGETVETERVASFIGATRFSDGEVKQRAERADK